MQLEKKIIIKKVLQSDIPLIEVKYLYLMFLKNSLTSRCEKLNIKKLFSLLKDKILRQNRSKFS